MNNGTRPTRINHRDFDFIQSHKLGSVSPAFSNEFFADAGLTMPNQDVADTEFTPPTPPLPFGCTDFTQSDVGTDLTGQIHNPLDLENVTHANALGGYDIRKSLTAAIGLGWYKQFFNIVTSGVLDYFDSFRLAQLMGVSANEKRSISWGTPWFQSWENAARSGTKIMPMPTDQELQLARNNDPSIPWHNSKLDGWTSMNGILVYRDKSWQGTTIGFLFFPREVINMVMGIKGTAAFVPTNTPIENPVTISVSTLQWIVSVLRNMLERYI